MIPLFKKIALATLPLLIALVVWQTAALSVLYFREVDFPTPSQTLLRLVCLFTGERFLDYSLYRHIGSSLQRWVAGFGISAVLGICYGLLTGAVPLFEKATAKIPQMLLLIPGLAWIPVALLLFGIGEPATIFMIVIAAFAPIAINVQSGVKNIDIRLIRAATMMGAGKRILFFQVLLPASLPSLLSGLRIGIGAGWRVLVAAEMVIGTGAGLGYAIIQVRWTLDYASSFACIVVICCIGLLCEQVLFGWIERRMNERRGRQAEP